MNEPSSDPLALKALPRIAAVLRERKEAILARWNELVCQTVPDADPLTTEQVRDTLPRIIDQMVRALESAEKLETAQLLQTSQSHGGARFHQSYSIRELFIEFRILRLVMIEEIDRALRPSGGVTLDEWLALATATDIILQQSVVRFVEHQRAQLKSATDAEAKFLSFLAHDLRNSLNSILLTMQWAASTMGGAQQEQKEALESAREEATRTIDGMERLLQAERLRKGVQVKREQVYLAGLVEPLMQEGQRATRGKPLRLESRIPADARVLSDGSLVSIILHNLLSNAIKYSERGFISIEARRFDDESNGAWEVGVHDQGPGIAPEKVASLFEAFTRGETHGQPGVGLGLFIASQAARLLGTRLEVESTLGEGTRFFLLLRDLPNPTTL